MFPELPGLEWEATKKPVFRTKIMESVNGRELRASYQAEPKYEINLSYAFLREWKGKNELQQLESFFLTHRGSFDSFLLNFHEDNEFECEFVGDGVTTTFQLYKQLHHLKIPLSHTKPQDLGAIDPLMWNADSNKLMWNIDPLVLMWSFGHVGITSNGLLVLSAPLSVGQKIQVVGTYYYRCRFADDEQEYTHFLSKLWKAKKVNLIGSLGNKV